MAAKVFVGNLNFQTTRTELEQLFAQVGQIKDVFLPTDRATDRPRGFAFVEFGLASIGERYVFDIGGNRFRLIARINFAVGVVAVRWFGTHAEYDHLLFRAPPVDVGASCVYPTAQPS